MSYVYFLVILIFLLLALLYVWKINRDSLQDDTELTSENLSTLVQNRLQQATDDENEKFVDSEKQKWEQAGKIIERNWLEGIEGEVKGRYYHIGFRTVTLGRGVGNYIQIIDENISRVHARFIADENQVVAYDLGSSNGIFLDGHKINEMSLKDGDVLCIGDSKLLFHAQAQFEKNHGFDPKTLNEKISSQTTSNMEMEDIREVLKNILLTVDNDYEKASEILNMDIGFLKKAVKRSIPKK